MNSTKVVVSSCVFTLHGALYDKVPSRLFCVFFDCSSVECLSYSVYPDIDLDMFVLSSKDARERTEWYAIIKEHPYNL